MMSMLTEQHSKRGTQATPALSEARLRAVIAAALAAYLEAEVPVPAIGVSAWAAAARPSAGEIWQSGLGRWALAERPR